MLALFLAASTCSLVVQPLQSVRLQNTCAVARRTQRVHCCDTSKTSEAEADAPSPAPSAEGNKPVAGRTFSDDWSGAGRYADEDKLPLSFWLLGPNPRRGILVSLGIWGLIAPATNLWGTGSFFLSLFPDAARDKRLDTFYPISTRPLYPYSQGYLNYDAGGFKRYYDDSGRFEFRYPANYGMRFAFSLCLSVRPHACACACMKSQKNRVHSRLTAACRPFECRSARSGCLHP
jgi:hypothetical protein